MGTILKKGLSPLSTAWVGVSDCRRAKTLVFGGLPAPKKRWAGGVQGGLLCSKGVGELKKVHGISPCQSGPHDSWTGEHPNSHGLTQQQATQGNEASRCKVSNQHGNHSQIAYADWHALRKLSGAKTTR